MLSLPFLDIPQVLTAKGSDILGFIIMITAVSTLIPGAIIISVAEYRSITHPLYYILAGICCGFIGWLAFLARDSGFIGFFSLILPSGALGGIVYWLAAGRRAGSAWKAPDTRA